MIYRIARFNRILLVVVASILLGACASAPPIQTEIPAGRVAAGSTVGVVWLSQCFDGGSCEKTAEVSNQGYFAPIAAGGIVGVGIAMSANEEVIDVLKTVSADPIVDERFIKPMAEKLGAQGFKVKSNPNAHYVSDIGRIGKRQFVSLTDILEKDYPRENRVYMPYYNQFHYDLSTLAESTGVDTLIVLEVMRFSVNREFGPLVIPMTAPHGLSTVRAFVYDAASKEILFNDYAIAEQFAESEWKQPGDWGNLLAATNDALGISIDTVTASLTKALAGLSN